MKDTDASLICILNEKASETRNKKRSPTRLLTGGKQMLKMSALALCVAAAMAGTSPVFAAEDPIKVGLLLPLSGTFTEYGKQMENGIRVFLKEHGDTVAGRKIELVIKDDGGIAPEKAKKAAQELIV